jgi:S1-C subfamily serine protease
LIIVSYPIGIGLTFVLGNSGGPAVNMRGEVIGISDLGLGDFGAENLNFLIPSDTVNRIIPSLISTGTYKHPWLGLEGIDMTSSIAKVLNLQEPKGFLVVNVDDSGPASKAGIFGGDKGSQFAARRTIDFSWWRYNCWYRWK